MWSENLWKLIFQNFCVDLSQLIYLPDNCVTVCVYKKAMKWIIFQSFNFTMLGFNLTESHLPASFRHARQLTNGISKCFGKFKLTPNFLSIS